MGKKLAGVEAAALFGLIMGYIWIWRRTHPYLLLGMVAWMIASHLLRRESARDLGFGRGSLRECAHRFAPLLTVLALTMLAGGLLLNTTRKLPPNQAFLALAAYLPWGIVQQYAINGYFLRRFDPVFTPRRAAWLTAVLFSLAHLPNLLLMAVALGGGWISTKVYRRHRNLYFLGMAHATVGFLLYATVPDSISHHLEIGPGMLQRQHVVRAIQ